MGEACLTRHMGLPGAPQEAGAFRTTAGHKAPSPGKRAWAPRFETRPAGGGPGTHELRWGPSYASPASGACAEAWGLPHTVRVWTQTRARASRITATKNHMGRRAHGGRVQAPPRQGPCSGPSCFLQTPQHSGLLLTTLWSPWPPVQVAGGGEGT